jgi:hypothetical protein
MAPRGLKTLLKQSSPARLTGSGKFKIFTVVRQGHKTGTKLKGITKRLQKRLWSRGVLPSIAKRADPRPGGHWRGPKGGRQRGAKVDAQLTRAINSGAAATHNQSSSLYKLSKVVLSGLASKGLEPVLAQRAVISENLRLGTAADIVAYDKKLNRLVFVELKCGFDNGRGVPSVHNGRDCRMRGPLSGAWDSNTSRHLAQLAATHALFLKEKNTLARMAELGVSQQVDGILLYANDKGVEFFDLTPWWKKRALQILQAIA